MLGWRRRARKWNALRVAVGLLGAFILAVDLAERSGVVPAACGAAMMLFALVIPPERRRPSVDERARELGALVVVDGGQYRGANGSFVEARLFIGPDRLWALGADLGMLFEVSLDQLGPVRAEAEKGSWKLCLSRGTGVAEFFYRGPFAEHLARVAESTLRSQLRRELPVLP